MPHRICTSEQGNELSYFQRLFGTLLSPDTDLASKLERLFAEETIEFDLSHAFLSRIDLDTETQYFEVVHEPQRSVEAGNTVPLSNTYCRETIEDPDGMMVIDDAFAEGWKDYPAYETLGFRSYIGTTVTSENKLYGTLCFGNATPRETPIAEDEKILVDIFSQWVTYELNQWQGPQIHDPVHGDFAEYDVPSSEIDSLLETVKSRERRLILRSLVDDPTERRLEQIVEPIDADPSEIDLFHTHLPKLEQAGYIRWDRDSNTISRGTNFFEIEPLVGLLDDFTAEFRG
ncbi:hypothetical protein GRX03_03585 [Halovenus sp. WSH3]|uniref:GAF domain-containing protein n=1 Tax=Halovenus carboxidivorans TaxID=2692199 RepID=A0A6B0T724_9EURY|nr:GAF domain-containing protein [Halovenus carboxidivorans]MXR50690.1 hypothetical protein [Halovenus carboxidivorans]